MINSPICDELNFKTKWIVWLHNIENKSWTLDSYINIYTINNIISFWKFFNYFHLINKKIWHIFIMREGIMPIWEDDKNKNGGICSLKLDFGYKNKNELSSEIMACLCLLIINETLVLKPNVINGISYASKLNRSIFIKLWIDDYKNNLDFVNTLPKSLLQLMNNRMMKEEKSNNISILYKKVTANE